MINYIRNPCSRPKQQSQGLFITTTTNISRQSGRKAFLSQFQTIQLIQLMRGVKGRRGIVLNSVL